MSRPFLIHYFCNMQIPIQNLESTSPLIKDYLLESPKIKNQYGKPLSFENVIEQTRQKKLNYQHRALFSTILKAQMKDLSLSEKQKQHLSSLEKENCFCITTGHQLNLYTGPLYFIYKILQAVKMADQLNSQQLEFHYVPIFWMATEDHDFEEINHCFLNDETIDWNPNESIGGVGRARMQGIDEVNQKILAILEHSSHFESIKTMIEQSYQSEFSLSHSTRLLVHSLLKEFGILILDADDKDLKTQLIPYCKEELEGDGIQKFTAKTIAYLDKNRYKIQVNPRAINLFYLTDTNRNRIVRKGEEYSVLNTDLEFTKSEIIQELETYPERFSPNALMRPFYQEVILPNVAYIGGNAEIAYWLELKDYFSKNHICFPVIVARNSFMFLEKRQIETLKKLGLETKDLLLEKRQIEQKIVQHFSLLDLELPEKEQEITDLYDDLIEKSIHTDISLRNLLEAQKTKQLKAFQKVEKRLYKAEKRVLSDKIQQFDRLYNRLYPKGIQQERIVNVYQFYQERGDKFLKDIYLNMNVWESCVNMVEF